MHPTPGIRRMFIHRRLIGSNQAADFSRIRNADLGRFSVDRLVRIINKLDEATEVSVQLAPRAKVRADGVQYPVQ